jgi:hypothetical protein
MRASLLFEISPRIPKVEVMIGRQDWVDEAGAVELMVPI